jgi:hypothetical protein
MPSSGAGSRVRPGAPTVSRRKACVPAARSRKEKRPSASVVTTCPSAAQMRMFATPGSPGCCSPSSLRSTNTLPIAVRARIAMPRRRRTHATAVSVRTRPASASAHARLSSAARRPGSMTLAAYLMRSDAPGAMGPAA